MSSTRVNIKWFVFLMMLLMRRKVLLMMVKSTIKCFAYEGWLLFVTTFFRQLLVHAVVEKNESPHAWRHFSSIWWFLPRLSLPFQGEERVEKERICSLSFSMSLPLAQRFSWTLCQEIVRLSVLLMRELRVRLASFASILSCLFFWRGSFFSSCCCLLSLNQTMKRRKNSISWRWLSSHPILMGGVDEKKGYDDENYDDTG